jgi:hypothetical protein
MGLIFLTGASKALENIDPENMGTWEDGNYIEADIPVFVSENGRYILTTGERHTGIVLIDTFAGESITISDVKGAGYYASISPDHRYVCYKAFKRSPESVLQKSILFDIKERREIPLNDWSPLAGTPAVSRDSRIAFTTGNRLFIKDKEFNLIYDVDLKHHVNLLSFSADGQKIAFNNNSEQIVVLDIPGKSINIVSQGEENFWGPKFSPEGESLLFSSTGSRIFYKNLGTMQCPEDIGEGFHPVWLDEKRICFVKKTVKNHKVVNTEIVVTDVESGETNNIPLFEGDANVAVSGKGTCYNISGELSLGFIGDKGIKTDRNIDIPALSGNTIQNDGSLKTLYDKGTTRELEGVPVIHQVYDVSNWWWGHWSCGPTAALMCIQYYGILPKHTFVCTHYSNHKSNYGFYIPDIYSFNGYTYNIGAWVEPAGATAYGGHGFIWQENGNHTSVNMRDLFIQHGPSSSVDWSATWAELQKEIMDDHPFVVLSLITTSGHYQSVIGYFKNQHTLIVNDPYGDKNTPGYPTFDGQRCLYDWPGYNNGYENLNTVSAYVYCRYSVSSPPPILGTDIVVDNDDGAPDYVENGTWTTSGYTGYNGGTYRYAYADNASTATWTCSIVYKGDYEVFAIYRQDPSRASSARYKVCDDLGTHNVYIDQTGDANGMVETLIGVFSFHKGQYAVSLGCQGSAPSGSSLIADAIRFKLVSTIVADNDDGSPAYSETGTWGTSSNKGHNGKTYRYSTPGSSAKATWTVDLQHTGDYEVSVVNRAWESYVTSAKFDINTPFGIETVYVDQTQDSLEWKNLGTYSFHEGVNTMSVDAAGCTGGVNVMADAVRFSLSRIAFVVDNDDGSPDYVESGTWTTSVNPGYNGGTYRWADGGAGSTATWSIDLPYMGLYEVFALVRKGGDRCANVKYTISAASGDVDVYIDQAGAFQVSEISLGTYLFNSGNNTVIVDASSATPVTTNCVISDAVRFDFIAPVSADAMKFQNALQNGGFEDDFNHWSKPSATNYTILTSGAHRGNKACQFYNTTGYATIWQNPGEVNGETWRTTSWAYAQTGTTFPGFGFKDQSGNTEAGVTIDSTTWDFYSVDWTIADDIDSQAWGTSGNVVIDDVRCGKASRMNWITDWIRNGIHGSDLNTDYFAGDGGEANLTPAPGEQNGGNTWMTINQPDGFIDLASEIGGNPTNCVTYAHVYVNADTEKNNIFLAVGSDDGIKVILNGVAVHTIDIPRSHDYFNPDLDLIHIYHLPAGENRLMLKIKNVGSAYSFSARFCNEYGECVSGLTYSLGTPQSTVNDWFLYK